MTNPLHAPSIRAVIEAASAASGLPVETVMFSRERAVCIWRDCVLRYVSLCGYTFASAAKVFEVSVAAVSSAVKRSRGPNHEDAFRRLKDEVAKEIEKNTKKSPTKN